MDNRYSRQILFNSIGEEGQQKLKKSRVLLVGAGALGASSAEMLVRAGIGHLSIVDRDYVELSNLQRQQLYTESDVETGAPKAQAAARRLSEINRNVEIEPFVSDFFDYASRHSISNYDLIMDATDNFETRLYINDLAQKYQLPWIYGGVIGSTGMTYTIIPGKTPCLSCILKKIPSESETCDMVGVIAPVIQWVTAHQVTEAMKLLTGKSQDLRGTLLSLDIWFNLHTDIDIRTFKRIDCPSCGTNPTFPYLQQSLNTRTTMLCGRDTIQIRPVKGETLNRMEVERRLAESSEKIVVNDFLIHALLDKERRIVVFRDGRVLLHGITNVDEAQAMYNKYILD